MCLCLHPIKAAIFQWQWPHQSQSPHQKYSPVSEFLTQTLARLSQDSRRLRYYQGAPILSKTGFSCEASLAELIQYIKVQGHILQRTQNLQKSEGKKRLTCHRSPCEWHGGWAVSLGVPVASAPPYLDAWDQLPETRSWEETFVSRTGEVHI